MYLPPREYCRTLYLEYLIRTKGKEPLTKGEQQDREELESREFTLGWKNENL